MLLKTRAKLIIFCQINKYIVFFLLAILTFFSTCYPKFSSQFFLEIAISHHLATYLFVYQVFIL